MLSLCARHKSLCHAFLVLALLLMPGCRSTEAAREAPQVPSHAIAQDEKTTLGDALAADVAAHPGMSGFRILKTGSESYAMRLGLIQAAEKTLDLQYYSIHDDVTSNLLLEAVVRAAQRGVRVRLLIDGINVGAVADTFSVLDEFKNVQIRVFNPFATRDDGLVGRMVTALTDLDSVNRRMHNKTLIADNQMSIMGGRNLGDEYFEENPDVTFRDIDILTAGPITAAISKSFDDYWNHKDAVPMGQLERPRRDPLLIRQTRAELAAHWEKTLKTEKGAKLLKSSIAARLKDADIPLTWARAEVAVDTPHKIDPDSGNDHSRPLNRLDALLDHAEKEFIAVSPYFVPREEGVEWIKGLIARGIDVRIITNSLASTDVVAVHTGYRRYRDDVVKSGAELYEMKPIAGDKPRQRLIGKSAPAAASLHAKVYVVDRKETMIGSFNLDPRSVELNTEIALVIHSVPLSLEMVEMFEEVIDPATSYRVTLDDSREEVVWQTEKDGRMMESRSEPAAGFWRGLQSRVMALLPIEDSL